MLLDDAHRMLQQYMDPIRHRALQIYHSVPVMIPMCALYETMKPQRSDGFRLLSPRPPCWDFQPGIDHAHTYSANSLKWSSDGTRVITSSQDKTARIWDAQTGAHLVVLEGHEDWVHAASFSSQTTRAVTGSSDKTIRLWDVQTGRQLSAIRRDMADFWVLAVAFSPDDTQVVSGSLDGIVRVWDVVTGNEIAALSGHVHAVNSVTYLGGRLYSRSLDDTIFSWVCEGSTIGEYAACPARPLPSRDLFSEEEDRWAPTELNPISSPLTVLVWDEDSGWLSIKPGLRQSLQPLCWLPPLRRGYKFSAFGSRVAFGSEDGSLTILDLGDALEIQDGHRPHVWKDRGGEWSAALHSQLIIDAQSNVDLHRIRPHRGEMDGEKS
jgi:WD40 repeat protein